MLDFEGEGSFIAGKHIRDTQRRFIIVSIVIHFVCHPTVVDSTKNTYIRILYMTRITTHHIHLTNKNISTPILTLLEAKKIFVLL